MGAVSSLVGSGGAAGASVWWVGGVDKEQGGRGAEWEALTKTTDTTKLQQHAIRGRCSRRARSRMLEDDLVLRLILLGGMQ